MADKGKDARGPGWFWADNKMVDTHAAKIGVHALAVYMVLVRHLNGDEECWPSSATIAKKLGISQRTVIKSIQTLAAEGLIEITPREEQGKGQISNLYTVHRIGSPTEQDAPPPMQEIHRGYAPDAGAPMHDVHTNKTKENKTQETISGGDPGSLSAQDAAAALRSLGLDSELRRKVLAARSDLTQDEIAPWGPWLLNPPAWSDRPFAFCAKALVNHDPVPVERAKSNSKRTGPAPSEAPDYDIHEARRRGADLKAEILKGLPEWA